MTSNVVSSSTKSTNFVLQGSIPRPMFLIYTYINDMCSICKFAISDLFADDENFFPVAETYM